MSKKHYWHYSSTERQQVGTMICTVCRKVIENGQYRYRETDLAYLPQHRKCSEFDSAWSKFDKQNSVYLMNLQEFLKDCLAFRVKWSTDVLDDDIESTEEALKKSGV